ncbi:surface antigen, partial [Plasmodium falciparum UGT5.1]
MIPCFSIIYNQRNHNSTTPHHPPNTRLLCECELYTPANYDNDPQMKAAMHDFDRQTSQRFHEYDERMKTTRQKCKDQCDKEIQKIILKDKLEKELMDKFATLHTDIQSDAIPTCICEKSMADKTEKFCLNCGMGLGGGLLQASSLLGGIGAVAVNAWKAAELVTAKKLAAEAGAAAGLKAGNALGMKIVIKVLKDWGVDEFCPVLFKSIGNTTPYNDSATIISAILAKKSQACSVTSDLRFRGMCETFGVKFGLRDAFGIPLAPPPEDKFISEMINGLAEGATQAADAAAKAAEKSATAAAIETSTGAIDAASTHLYSTIAYSITAILIIVLIM